MDTHRSVAHGSASPFSGKWVVVWRDGTPLNGKELVLNGIALDRAKDDVSGEYGLRDGSAGLLGDLVKSDDWQEIRKSNSSPRPF